MGYNPQWVQWIRQDAPRYGIDPEAALAIASHEGLSGAVGDGGHAFGPFQLNDAGGVLTNRPGDHRSFAESRAGVQWALQQMAAAGAKGLKGRAAVETIASKFERPRNVAGEISDAWSRYGKIGATTGSVNSSPTGNLPLGIGGAQGATGALSGDPKKAMAAMLLQSVQGGGNLNPNGLLQMAQMRQQQNAAVQTYGPTPTAGSLIPQSKNYKPGGAAGGFLSTGASYKVGRVDQGHDFQTNPGGAIVAPGNGVVVAVKSDPHGFGPSYPVVHFTSGPYAGKSIYIGHTIAALKPGQQFQQGQTISHTGTSPVGNATVPGWAEIGFANTSSLPVGWGTPPF